MDYILQPRQGDHIPPWLGGHSFRIGEVAAGCQSPGAAITGGCHPPQRPHEEAVLSRIIQTIRTIRIVTSRYSVISQKPNIFGIRTFDISLKLNIFGTRYSNISQKLNIFGIQY